MRKITDVSCLKLLAKMSVVEERMTGSLLLCAQKAKASALLTFNVRDFTSFSLQDVEIYLPEASESG